MDTPPPTPEPPKVRVRAPIIVLASIILIGAVTLFALGRGRWSFADAIYFAVNAVATVGFRELPISITSASRGPPR